MNYPFYIAKKLEFSELTGGNSSILRFALSGISLAVMIMLLSIVVVGGFKQKITETLYSLGNHVSINAIEDYNMNVAPPVRFSLIDSCVSCLDYVKSVCPVIEKYAVLKTDSDFQGVKIRGTEESNSGFDMDEFLVKGRAPIYSDSTIYEVVISQNVSDKLALDVGQKVLSYFVDDKVRVRNLQIVGIYDTNFDEYDDVIVHGNINMLRPLNGWGDDECTYVGVDLKNTDNIHETAYEIYSEIYNMIIRNGMSNGYSIDNLYDSNISYFAWLDLLDSNIVMILVLMAFVAGFTIVAAMLVIVLDRIRTIGVLKSLGATDGAIRSAFVWLTQWLVIKGIIIGNVAGVLIALLQKWFHIVKLDPASYYMAWVPVQINILEIVVLDVCVVAFAFVTLSVSSLMISRMKISSSIRYE